jgi:membrane dipeptidase
MKTTCFVLGTILSLAGCMEKPARPTAPQPHTAKKQPETLHQRAIVFDSHCDTVLRILKKGIDIGQQSEEGHIDIPRMKAGGLDVQVFALWVEPDYWADKAAKRTLEMADAIMSMIEKYPDHLDLALTVKNARRIVKQNKTAVFMGIEGGHAIQDSLALLRMYHRIGVRYMTLTWMKNTNWADGSGDKPKHNGLTELGKQIVREMNRLGMLVDISHVSDKTFYDVLEVTSKPVIASHSGCRAICDHYRNLDDDMLRALSKNGGVIGINYFVGFLDNESARLSQALWDKLDILWEKHKDNREKYLEVRKPLVDEYNKNLPKVPLDRLIEHIDHVVKVAGIDHVGLGSDFDGISITPVGLDDASDLPLITDKLIERGYSEEDIKKILGENMLRVFEAAIGE